MSVKLVAELKDILMPVKALPKSSVAVLTMCKGGSDHDGECVQTPLLGVSRRLSTCTCVRFLGQEGPEDSEPMTCAAEQIANDDAAGHESGAAPWA